MNELNPYESPRESADRSAPPELDISLILRNFHTHLVALGASWMVLGGICGCCFLIPPPGEGPSASINAVIFLGIALWGLVVFVVGICACMKKLWAAYVGLGFMLLTVVFTVGLFPICGIVLTVIGILQALQARRIIGWALKLRKANVPLTAKPEDFRAI